MRTRKLLLALSLCLSAPALAAIVNVTRLVAVSSANKISLKWDNPLLQHDGVLILRSLGSPPTTSPTNGTSYAVGATIGNATVVLSEPAVLAGLIVPSLRTTFDDTSVTNGTKYYYRVFNHATAVVLAPLQFADGNVPSSDGVMGEPRGGTVNAPRWCYASGLASIVEPVVQSGQGVMWPAQNGALSKVINFGSSEGSEAWRPVEVGGSIQARAPVVPIYGRANRCALVGDQTGKTYLIDATTGTQVWAGNAGIAIGDAVQAQPGAQLFDYANAAYKTAHPSRDLLFFATRNNSSTNNKVVALSGVSGLAMWTYAPGDLDILSGGMMVDYARNRLWVAARSAGGAQASLRVLNSLTGAEVGRLSLGDIDHGVVRGSGTALVVNNAGTAYGIDLESLSVRWSVNLGGAPSRYLWPMSNGFVATLKTGAVVRYTATTTSATLMWSTPVPVPSGVRASGDESLLFVGSSDGKLHQLVSSTGEDSKQVQVSTSGIGAPALDGTTGIYVGTMDGRLCSFALPL